MEILCKLIKDTVKDHQQNAHWFCEDFNLPNIDWSMETFVKNEYFKRITEIYLETIQHCDLNQVVDFPTRGNNTLNFFFNKSPNRPSNCLRSLVVQAEIDCNAALRKLTYGTNLHPLIAQKLRNM